MLVRAVVVEGREMNFRPCKSLRAKHGPDSRRHGMLEGIQALQERGDQVLESGNELG